jgi:hypothetical protein
LAKDFSTALNSTSFEHDIQSRIKYENNVFLAKTKHISKRLNVIDTLISDKQRSWGSRNKRLVVAPVVGTVLKFLFGTADNNDVVTIHRRIEELGTVVNKIHHINEVQATLLQTLHNDNAAQDVFLDKLTSATNNLMTNLARLRKDFDSTAKREEFERRAMFTLLANIEIVRDTIDRADNMIQDLLIDVSAIAAGKIPPHLLPPDLLVEGLQAVSKVLPNGNTLLSPTSSGVLWDYYHLTIVNSIVLQDGLRLFIDLPIIVPRSTFDLYNIIPFPTQIPSTNNFTIIEIMYPFLALSKDHDYYVPLTPTEIEACHPIPSPVCIQQFPIWKATGATSCELSIVLRDDQAIAENCKMSVINTSDSKLVFLYENFWAYFFPYATTVRFNCNGNVPNPAPMSLIGSGTLIVPTHCTAQSKNFFIRAGIRGNSSISSKRPTILLPPLETLPLPPSITNLQNTTQLVQIQRIHNEKKDWLISFQELESSIKKNRPVFQSLEDRLDYFSTEKTFETVTTSLISTSGLFLLLCAVSLAIFLGKKRFCPLHRRTETKELQSQIDGLEKDIRTLRAFTLSELEIAKNLILQQRDCL